MLHPEETSPHVGVLLWRFEEGHSKDDAESKETYAWLQQVISDFSSHEHNFYYDIDHPSIIIMIGGWDSLEAHFAELHKSEEFVEMLEALGEMVDMRSNFHVNMGTDALEKITKGEVLMFGRVWVADEDEAEFAKRWTEGWVESAEKAAGKGRVATGWRINEGLWLEKDAIEYWESEGGVAADAKEGDGNIEDSDLQAMNELLTLVGFDSIEQQERVCKGAEFPNMDEYKGLVKRSYTRRFAKMDLST